MTKQLESLVMAKQINNICKTRYSESTIIVLFCFVIFICFYLLTQFLAIIYEYQFTYYKSEMTFTYYDIIFMMFNFFMPMVLFSKLDKKHTMLFWNKWGTTINENDINSSESKRYAKLIYYPLNTYSSSFQILAGSYFIVSSRNAINYETTLFLGLTTSILGVLSYLWWSSSKAIFQKYDHIFMELHCLSLGTMFLSIAFINNNYNCDIYLVIAQLLYLFFRRYSIIRSKIGLMIVYINTMSLILIVTSQKVGNINLYYYGLLTIIMGIINKSFDKMYNIEFGTALFHLCAAITSIMLFEWSQTMYLQ